MANIKSAKKRARTAEKRRLYNKAYKSTMKTKISKFNSSLENAVDREEIKARLKDASRIIDKMVSKGILHKNNAARKKSKLEKNYQKTISNYPESNSESYPEEELQ